MRPLSGLRLHQAFSPGKTQKKAPTVLVTIGGFSLARPCAFVTRNSLEAEQNSPSSL